MHPRRVAAAVGALLAASVLYLPPTAARAADHPRQPVTIAHRGASAYAPENTLAAVEKARELGITWVENDVQRTRDGELVVLHDTTLSRTTDAEEVFPDRSPWNVSDFTLAEVKQLDAGSWFSASFADERVPTLDEYLAEVERNDQNLLLEIKAPDRYPGIERDTLRELKARGWLSSRHVRHRLVVQSFSADCVRAVHARRPEVRTGFLGTPAVAELRTYAAFVDQINPHKDTVTSQYVKAVHAVTGAHGKALEVHTWTVNDAETATRVAGLGVDGIITNTPDVVREATAPTRTRALTAASP